MITVYVIRIVASLLGWLGCYLTFVGYKEESASVWPIVAILLWVSIIIGDLYGK
jgi:drug/metabolite transporter superfamily protein YnfA